MQVGLIDIGLNLTHKQFASDRAEVIQRAQQAGVVHMVLTGTSVAGSEAACQLAQQYAGLMTATAGVHPHDAKHWHADSAVRLNALLQQPCVVAVGECGLDFNRDFSPRPQQERAFEQQLELAVQHQLPVFMHERDAAARMLPILRQYRDQLTAGVVHCFTGDTKTLYQYLDLDLHIGVTGWICDERRGQLLQQQVRDIPLQRLMIETDAPFLLPRDLAEPPSTKRNEPAYLKHIAQRVAQLRGESYAELLNGCFQTSCQFFHLAQTGIAKD